MKTSRSVPQNSKTGSYYIQYVPKKAILGTYFSRNVSKKHISGTGFVNLNLLFMAENLTL